MLTCSLLTIEETNWDFCANINFFNVVAVCAIFPASAGTSSGANFNQS